MLLMSSWFKSTTTSSSTSQSAEPDISWPPHFQSYEGFYKELNTAIEQDPGFGIWLRKYRNENMILRSDEKCTRMCNYVWTCENSGWMQYDESKTNFLNKYKEVPASMSELHMEMFGISLNELKTRYVNAATKQNNANNLKRALIELHLDSNKQKYDEANDTFADATQSFEDATAKFKKSRLHGYQNYYQPPHPPVKPQKLRERELLQDMLQHCNATKLFDMPSPTRAITVPNGGPAPATVQTIANNVDTVV